MKASHGKRGEKIAIGKATGLITSDSTTSQVAAMFRDGPVLVTVWAENPRRRLRTARSEALAQESQGVDQPGDVAEGPGQGPHPAGHRPCAYR